MLLGMSQEKLAEKLGLTFQQVQKYEKGINRIGASRLFDLSKVLGVRVDFFYEDAPASDGGAAAAMAGTLFIMVILMAVLQLMIQRTAIGRGMRL